MAKIMAEGKTFEVDEGTNLREALLDREIHLYNPGAKIFNCRGHGICGTCLVQVEGSVSVPTAAETRPTLLHPHLNDNKRRLACQTRVLGDLLDQIRWLFWGWGRVRLDTWRITGSPALM